jgi:hypothetical protein
MIFLYICQPCVPERGSGLLDHLTPHFIMSFSTECGCFLFIADVHLLTGYMALQTIRSVLIAICTGQLAWAVWHYKSFDQC